MTTRRFGTRALRCVVLVFGLAASGRADEAGVIASMDDLPFQPPKARGTAEGVAGKVGKAERLRFEGGSVSTFFTSKIHGQPDWNSAAGFSFWIKKAGTEADGFGGLQLIFDDDYAVRYDLCFPVKGDGWSKINVAWSDLIPALPGPRARPLGNNDARNNLPSKVSAFWFGKWWYWQDYPAIAFDVDEIRLEPSIARDLSDHQPDSPPLARLLARLKARQPVTIVTMGDSLTDKHHWSNREVAWVDLLREQLKSDFGSNVTIINPAIGGTQLRQNLVLLPRWLAQAPEPDLVTIFFGGNDWDSGMRGVEFQAACTDAVNRIRRATNGKADVLLMTTNPTTLRWTELGELAGACRASARDTNAGLADTETAFHLAGKDDRDRLYGDDRVHLSRAGHQVVAETVLKAILASGR